MRHIVRLRPGALWVALATLLVGPLPIAILSAIGNAFLPSAPVDVPYLSLPMLTLGDFVALPFFNAYLYTLAAEVKPWMRRTAGALLVLLVVGIALSVVTQYLYHQYWVNDNLTGFMDYGAGALSPAGQWHLVFSIVQSTAVYMYVVVWIMAYRFRSSRGVAIGLSGWHFYLVFASLGIVNVIIAWLRPNTSPSLGELLRSNWLAVGHFALALIVYLAARFGADQQELLPEQRESRGDAAMAHSGSRAQRP